MQSIVQIYFTHIRYTVDNILYIMSHKYCICVNVQVYLYVQTAYFYIFLDLIQYICMCVYKLYICVYAYMYVCEVVVVTPSGNEEVRAVADYLLHNSKSHFMTAT